MGKFAVECNVCGNYVTAYSGIRGVLKKEIKCTCGNTIDVDSSRTTAVLCPTCNNAVVYDQGKSKKQCPVCNSALAPGLQGKISVFNCPQCFVELSAPENTKSFECPICSTTIDVVREAGKKKLKNQGEFSVIKYEGDNNTFVWKHPNEDFTSGSQLIVHESQTAIFFRDGEALDEFGPGRYTLETQNLPLLNKAFKLPVANSASPFHSEVYFINMATQMGLKWGTSNKVRLLDPISKLHIEIGASGEFNLKVENPRKLLLKIVGTAVGLSRDDLISINDSAPQKEDGVSNNFRGYFRAMIANQVTGILAQTIKQEKISILEIDEKITDISIAIKEKINEYLSQYGLIAPEFFISRFVTPDDDKNFQRLKQQQADRHLKVQEEDILREEALAAAERKKLEAMTEAELRKIVAEGKAAEYRLQAEAEAYEMRAKGYTYQQETARKVGMEAMKNGIAGDGSGGGIAGNVIGLGLGLGAVGEVAEYARDSFAPLLGNKSHNIKNTESLNVQDNGVATVEGVNTTSWNCECNAIDLTSKFCPNCGKEKPSAGTWNCRNCHTTDLLSAFCPNCGEKRSNS